MTKKQILETLKALKEGQSIDLVGLPDLTPEELEVFQSRDVKTALEKMLDKKGITPEDDARQSDASEPTRR